MMSTFFVADTHFNDEDILMYENRPFSSIKEMNQILINNWNRVVDKYDTVYVLGDFGDISFLESLNGAKYLVKGNHDIQVNDFYRSSGFKEVYDYPIVLDDFWILSHAPLYVNENMPYANLFGHVHNSPIIKDYSSHHFCVSAERISYTPVSFEFIKEKVGQRNE